MDHFCLRFTRLHSADGDAAYKVESFDFNEYDSWEDVARLQVSLVHRDYVFEPGERWVRERILPPKFYALSEEEQAHEFREVWEPQQMGLGAYALRVHEFATHCIDEEALPERYPLALFPEAGRFRATQDEPVADITDAKRRDMLPTFGRDRCPVLEAGVLRTFADRVQGMQSSRAQGSVLGKSMQYPMAAEKAKLADARRYV